MNFTLQEDARTRPFHDYLFEASALCFVQSTLTVEDGCCQEEEYQKNKAVFMSCRFVLPTLLKVSLESLSGCYFRDLQRWKPGLAFLLNEGSKRAVTASSTEA